MHPHRLPPGLWPVMLTPFKTTYEIDYDALKQLTEFYIRAGATGLFANCLSGEMFQLTNEERLTLVKTVLETASEHSIPVVATATFTNDTNVSIDFIKRLHAVGVSAAVLITNQLAGTNESGVALKKNTEKILGGTADIPLGTYECPYPYKRLLSADMMAWLAKTNRFLYHKDTSCDMHDIEQKLHAMESGPLSFYNAHTATALSSLRLGADGLSPIGANFYPEFYSLLIAKHHEQEQAAVLQQLSDKLIFLDALASQCYPYSAKLFLQSRKLRLTTVCRIPHAHPPSDLPLKMQALKRVFAEAQEQFASR